MSNLGRKWTLILLTVPITFGWICLLIPAYNINMQAPIFFYVGRLLIGLGGGGFAFAPNVYVSEVNKIEIPYCLE